MITWYFILKDKYDYKFTTKVEKGIESDFNGSYLSCFILLVVHSSLLPLESQFPLDNAFFLLILILCRNNFYILDVAIGFHSLAC